MPTTIFQLRARIIPIFQPTCLTAGRIKLSLMESRKLPGLIEAYNPEHRQGHKNSNWSRNQLEANVNFNL